MKAVFVSFVVETTKRVASQGFFSLSNRFDPSSAAFSTPSFYRQSAFQNPNRDSNLHGSANKPPVAENPSQGTLPKGNRETQGKSPDRDAANQCLARLDQRAKTSGNRPQANQRHDELNCGEREI